MEESEMVKRVQFTGVRVMVGDKVFVGVKVMV
jgi:hypothetical protein